MHFAVFEVCYLIPGEGSGLPGLSSLCVFHLGFLLVLLLVFLFPAFLLTLVTSGALGMAGGRLRWLLLPVHAGHLSCAVHCHFVRYVFY